MPTVVGVDIFTTGRMSLKLKTDWSALKCEGASGLEQFSMAELYGATEERRD